MKALVLLLASVCAFGQTKAVDPCAGIPHCTTDPEVLKHGCWNCDELTEKYKNTVPKPLKCGKWEHMVAGENSIHQWCSDTDPSLPKGYCRQETISITPDRCAPIMHEVTEKDWQELMERLKKLEAAHLTIRNNVIFCPAGKHPSRAKGNISWDQMCVDDAKRAGKE